MWNPVSKAIVRNKALVLLGFAGSFRRNLAKGTRLSRNGGVNS
jgi:hypothetical protein